MEGLNKASGETANTTYPADTTSTGQLPPMDIVSLRRFIAPLSKEQLIELLASAALEHPQVYEKAQMAVQASPSSRRLMIRNIPFGSQDEDFVNLFKQYGEIEDATIVRDKDQRSRGYGFVTYRDVDSVRRALDAIITLDGRQLLSKLAADPFADFSAGSHGGQGSRMKLFVRNLSDSTDSETLKNIFSAYGEVDECAVVSDPTGRSRGYGFVTYTTPEAAIKAVQEPQRIINGRVAFVAFASPSKPKGQQAAANARRNPHMEGPAALTGVNPTQFGFPAFPAGHPYYAQGIFPQQPYPGLHLAYHPDMDAAARRASRF